MTDRNPRIRNCDDEGFCIYGANQSELCALRMNSPDDNWEATLVPPLCDDCNMPLLFISEQITELRSYFAELRSHAV
jgi:hypothetical protein